MCLDKMQSLKQQVLLTARSWLGTKFHHQGRSKKTAENSGGVDCIGLLVGTARELDLRDENDIPLHTYDKPNYSRIGIGDRLVETLNQHFDKTDLIEAPNVLLFAFMGQPQHLAIIGENEHGLTLIHAYSGIDKVVEHDLTEKWLKRVVGVYKWRF